MRFTRRSIVPLQLLIAGALGCSNLLPGTADLLEGDNAVTAAAAIKKKVGTDKVMVIRGEIRPHTMTLVVQSPKNPKDQDEYTYERGWVSGPEPVKIHTVFANHTPHANSIDEINFSAIPAMVERAKQLTDADGATVDLISMDSEYARMSDPSLTGKEGNQWDLTFRIFVEGTRSHKYFWANKNGTINETAY